MSLDSVVLDIEPIRPGEDGATAALRLLGRMRRLYGPRFFEVVTADAFYATGPFIRAVRRMGWGLVCVIKQERYEIYQEATALGARAASRRFNHGGREVELREVRELAFGPAGVVRIVMAQERWQQNRRVAGRTLCETLTSQWRWLASQELDPNPTETIWRIGHSRWGVENHAFNELTRYYHLDHCPHHEPTAIPGSLLIRVLAFNLFELFARFYGKLLRLKPTTLQEIALQLYRGIEHLEELQPLWSG